MALTGKWKELFTQEAGKPYFNELKTLVNEKRKQGDVYPVSEDVFQAMNLCSFENTKVVILGQDPYPGIGHAHGLAFSTKADKLPPSLKVIYDEITRSFFDAPFTISSYNNGDLTGWAKQGVLMLNRILTVDQGKPMSHAGLGWEKFTDAAIDLLLNEKEFVVWMLWGKTSRDAIGEKKSKSRQHVMFKSHHPQAQNYDKNNNFVGCNHFYLCNKELIKNGMSPISWDQQENPNIFKDWDAYLKWKKQQGIDGMPYYDLHPQEWVFETPKKKIRRDLITHPI